MLQVAVVVAQLRRVVPQIVELELGLQGQEGMALPMELVVVEVGTMRCYILFSSSQ